METSKLAAVLEGILFASGDGVEVADLTGKLNLKKNEFEKAISLLKPKYNEDSGINLIEYKGKIQFSTNPKFAQEIEDVLNPIKEKVLSKATLETLAIIAYKQPITRLEIEEIRGVGCDYAIDLLAKNGLIEVIGRKDAIGKPLLYATTDNFLKRFEIADLDKLPNYEQVLSRIKTIREPKEVQNTLYNEFEIKDEEESEQEQNEA